MISASTHPLPEWLDVSRETFDRLAALVLLLEKWNPAINLVSKASIPHVWQRHIVDSAQLFRLAETVLGSWLDLGSGGGFPGLIVAILAAEVAPDMQVILVEADKRKSTFLSHAIRQLGLQSTVFAERIETLAPQNADVISARAVAPLVGLLGYANRHMSRNGLALFPKGAQADSEIVEARKVWSFNLSLHQSRTDADATILGVRDIAHV